MLSPHITNNTNVNHFMKYEILWFSCLLYHLFIYIPFKIFKYYYCIVLFYYIKLTTGSLIYRFLLLFLFYFFDLVLSIKNIEILMFVFWLMFIYFFSFFPLMICISFCEIIIIIIKLSRTITRDKWRHLENHQLNALFQI